jgi:beta-galactosidase
LQILKPWILPSGNEFLSDPASFHQRPAGNPGGDIEFVQRSFDDSSWEAVSLPHDWAIKGPFYTGVNPVVPGNMGRLPVQGVGWYRQKLSVKDSDKGKSIYLDVDGALSYTMVWLNGNLVGGWPYGYNSFRLDLTPYLESGNNNQLAIRLDNPNLSARWYPGGGIYRNVWLTKVDPIHVGQWGTFITSRDVSNQSAILDLAVQVENSATTNSSRRIVVATDVHVLDPATGKIGEKVAEFPNATVSVAAGQKQTISGSATVGTPHLWTPQHPNLYVALTRLFSEDGGETIDTYETNFGIRSVVFDPNQGLLVNGERVNVQGVNNHHDLGAIGAAFNIRAAERHLEILQDFGCNAIRMSHNPPAPELLDLTDRMGFLVLDEIFDTWELNKTSNDFHLIFPDWHEQDLRSMIRRDRNHPSIVAWSYGNEVADQQTAEGGAAISTMLRGIVREEDPTRPSTSSENAALPGTPFPGVVEVISLNYQGAGIRDTNAYSNLTGIRTAPLYPKYHSTYPDKMIWSSESSSALSTRGTYMFPVVNDTSAPVNDTSGGDSVSLQVSAYELYTAGFGSSPDKVFMSQDLNPYVAGEFVWTGWDYLGEPTPYDLARSSYSGIVDLAGFKKDRFYLYQARWRPDLRMAHILPHWTWPERVGLVTPVHVFSAADEAELFLNGESLGRKTRGALEYRFRWDEVTYQPGELTVRTYKNGDAWANETVRTTGKACGLRLTADRSVLKAHDSTDLSFITAEVIDENGDVVPGANEVINFSLHGPGEIVATDNGFPADMTVFPSAERKAYSGLALAIIRADGPVTLTAAAEGLADAQLALTVQ